MYQSDGQAKPKSLKQRLSVEGKNTAGLAKLSCMIMFKNIPDLTFGLAEIARLQFKIMGCLPGDPMSMWEARSPEWSPKIFPLHCVQESSIWIFLL